MVTCLIVQNLRVQPGDQRTWAYWPLAPTPLLHAGSITIKCIPNYSDGSPYTAFLLANGTRPPSTIAIFYCVSLHKGCLTSWNRGVDKSHVPHAHLIQERSARHPRRYIRQRQHDFSFRPGKRTTAPRALPPVIFSRGGAAVRTMVSTVCVEPDMSWVAGDGRR